jgi:hypothetical protein
MTRLMLANLNRGELDGRRILQASSYELLWAKTTKSGPDNFVGLSWFVRDRAGHCIVYHGGGDTGFRSYIMLLPTTASAWCWRATGRGRRGKY